NEAVIGKSRVGLTMHLGVGIFPSAGFIDGNGGIAHVGIHVSSEDLREFSSMGRFRSFAHHAGLFLTSGLALVIQMSVPDAKLPSGLAIFQMQPVGKPCCGTVP